MDNNTLDEYRAVYLTAEDLRLAASILYNAYHDDPFFVDALSSSDKFAYEQKLRAAIREELNTLWQQKQALIGLFDGTHLVGVACVVTQEVPLGEGRYWHWRLKMLLGTGWQSTQAMMKKESTILELLPNQRCGVLQFIALAPNEQGKGLGHQLVQAAVSWCDEQPNLEGIGVFTTQEAHTHLFKQHDFVSLGELVIGSVTGQLLFYTGKHDE
ncbi:MAG: GNAT family N-acetyltransferase [Shewanella sp.]|uniref:GNAT family N-acetyltransferase n=1 Tax=Shewanella cutis TaxID=2766780 RepID=A0ABS9QTS7_9GAMM|nr:GNAT family N-acetyltransferase [Shewanella sp. PS-2]MCG9963747.1 GNAT family N-acetyltransferase [Shewanella sp. PS-2]